MKKIFYIIGTAVIIFTLLSTMVQGESRSQPDQVDQVTMVQGESRSQPDQVDHIYIIGTRGAPAARVNDIHQCLVWVPPGVWIPSTGAIIIGCPTVLINGLQAARLGDWCTAPPGPNVQINSASATVFIGGTPAARLGDTTTANQGIITTGSPTVLIG